MTLLLLLSTVASHAFPMIDTIDFGPTCEPIPQGDDRWWSEGRPGHEMKLVTVDTAVHPRALCNDGTAATYYARGGVGSDRWVVHLQGGGMCVDQQTCESRWCYRNSSDYSAEMMSSAYSHDSLLTGGIMDPDPVLNKFAEWNHVWIHSCSSDAFMGTAMDVDLEDALVPAESFRIHFLGRDILDAVLDELTAGRPELEAENLPSLGDASLVLLTGTTSGGIGVIHNLDRVAERLQAENPGVVVRGVLDSSTYPAADTLIGAPYTGTHGDILLSQYEMLMSPTDMYAGPGDASCDVAHESLGDAEWCDERMHVLTSHVATPFFTFTDQLDGENPLCQGDPSCASELRGQYLAFDDIANSAIPREMLPPEYPAAGPLPGYALSRCAGVGGGAHAVLTQPDNLGFIHRKIPIGAYVPGASTWVSFHDALWSWVEQDGGDTTILREADPTAPACPDPPPSAPTEFTAVFDEVADTVTFTWLPVVFATELTIAWSAEAPVPDGAPSLPVDVQPGDVAFVLTGPTPDQRCFAMRGANAEGVGPLSATVCIDGGEPVDTSEPDSASTPTTDTTTPVEPDKKGEDPRSCACDQGTSPNGLALVGWAAVAVAVRRRRAR